VVTAARVAEASETQAGTLLRPREINNPEGQMKTDTYTKIILTVIATCLLWSNFATPHTVVKAQEGQRVIIAGVDLFPRRASGGLPIYLTEPVEVEGKGCK